jgi:hypothetical protein
VSVAVALIVVAAIAGATIVVVVAVNAQRDALGRVVALADDQARRDADERHVLADRLQHPEMVRPFRTPAPALERAEQPAGGALAGSDVSHLTDQEILDEFGKDFLNGLG